MEVCCQNRLSCVGAEQSRQCSERQALGRTILIFDSVERSPFMIGSVHTIPEFMVQRRRKGQNKYAVTGTLIIGKAASVVFSSREPSSLPGFIFLGSKPTSIRYVELS